MRHSVPETVIFVLISDSNWVYQKTEDLTLLSCYILGRTYYVNPRRTKNSFPYFWSITQFSVLPRIVEKNLSSFFHIEPKYEYLPDNNFYKELLPLTGFARMQVITGFGRANVIDLRN